MGNHNGSSKHHPKAPPAHVGKPCPLCHETLYIQDEVDQLSTGKTAHKACKAAYAARKQSGDGAQWTGQDAAARRQMSAHRGRLLDGETFRSRKPSTWKLGSSPSSTPETR
jgi:hypothetical protein